MSFLSRNPNAFLYSVFIVIVLGFVGWCMNVYKLTQLDFEEPYRAEAIRAVGLIPPIGAVTGYITIGEEHEEN